MGDRDHLMSSSRAPRSRWAFWLAVSFSAVVLCFIGATGAAQFRALAFDQAALEIMDDAVPSIRTLSRAESGVQDLQLALEEQLDTLEHGGRADPGTSEGARYVVDQSMNDYLALPFFPAEEDAWKEILTRRAAFDAAVLRFESDVAKRDLQDARTTLRTEFPERTAALRSAISRSIDVNASYTYDRAVAIRRLRTSQMIMAFGLDAGAILVAVCGGLLAGKVVRAHSTLMKEYARLEEERASEFEQFADRVAHDILSPLDAVGTALYLAGTTEDAAQRTRVLQRGRNTLERIKQLVDGLLEFARSGAGSAPTARADVRSVMAGLAPDLEAAAAARNIELRMHTETAALVRCHTGVLTSLISNLSRNAIKYMGDVPIRSIDIRAFERGEWVRVEVEDTGPGLSPEIEAHVFDPYVRGGTSNQPGIGLGLATVKRLAESHGGRVGLRSVPGRGCAFWFELPKATPLAAATTTVGVATT